MKYRMKILSLFAMIALVAAIATGCNIFGFASDAEKTPVEKAEESISKGQYAKAKDQLAEASMDSTDAMVLYLNAKLALLNAGIDMAKIAELVEGQENAAEGDNLAILSMIDDMDDAEKTNWYASNLEVRSNLKKIWNEQSVGLLEKDDVALDFTISNMMSGVLGLRDTNRDGLIDTDDFQINLAFVEKIGTSGIEGFNFDGAQVKDENGVVLEDIQLDGLSVFLGDWQTESNGVAKIAAGKKYSPADINPLIAFVLSLLDEGTESLLILLGDNVSSFDTEEIEGYIDDIALVINYYWYHDGFDNDGDGRIDEEIINGKDDDGDGLTDEDSQYHPSDNRNVENRPIKSFEHLFVKWQKRQDKNK